MNTVLDAALDLERDAAADDVRHTAWLRQEIAQSLTDPRPGIPHDEAMARIRHTIAALKAQSLAQ